MPWISTESVNYCNKQEIRRQNLDDALALAFHLSYTPLVQNFMSRASLVAQWLRIHLSVQGTRV